MSVQISPSSDIIEKDALYIKITTEPNAFMAFTTTGLSFSTRDIDTPFYTKGESYQSSLTLKIPMQILVMYVDGAGYLRVNGVNATVGEIIPTGSVIEMSGNWVDFMAKIL